MALPSPPPEASPRELTALESATCGGVAGLVSRLVIAPLDIVKIRLQVRTPLGRASSASRGSAPDRSLRPTCPAALGRQTQSHVDASGRPVAPKYRGVAHAFHRILKDEGLTVGGAVRLAVSASAMLIPAPRQHGFLAVHSRRFGRATAWPSSSTSRMAPFSSAPTTS